MSDAETADEQSSVEYTTRIEDGKTIIDVTGEDAVAFVIRSAAGERIYLPPEEEFHGGSSDDAYQDSPYQSRRDSPYQSDSPYQPADTDSPYQPSPEQDTSTRGVIRTRTGFRITHPEPASEITLFRGSEAAV